MSTQFDAIISALDMAGGEDECPGLVKVEPNQGAAHPRSIDHPEETLAIERARHFNAHYVYFRYFPARPSVPVAYIYDWTSSLRQAPSNADLAELQRRLWSSGEVLLTLVLLPTQVLVFHALRGPKEGNDEVAPNPWKTIKIAADAARSLDALKEFSARCLDDGSFWEINPDVRKLKLEDAAFMSILKEIGNCRAELLALDVDDALVGRLLILFIMIKYLEERRDRDGTGVFPQGTFQQFAPGADGFTGLLRSGAQPVLAFLDHLAQRDRFNGEVFNLTEKERTLLLDVDLGPIANALEGRTDGRQITLWRRYAFNELPVELISHLYEQFLPDRPGVVYTPPFLVSFILDEVLPLSEPTPPAFKLLDPACGSGVFLVGAFKRLVQRWRVRNDFAYPDVATLKGILSNHLYGADSEGEAVRITLFSLSLALCDFLEPRVIWRDLHFDNLIGSNLFEGDFFDLVHQKRLPEHPDVVVGNPPFISGLTSGGRAEVLLLRKTNPAFDLPDQQIALLFLQTASRIAREGGTVALIQPMGPLLYNENSTPFRKQYLGATQVTQVVDLTHLSRVLFRRPKFRGLSNAAVTGTSNPGDVAVGVVFAEAREPEDEPLLHVTVRRTLLAEQKQMFEIDHYDLHFVSRLDAARDPGVWKANFIGGGRIHRIVRRLLQAESLETFLRGKKKHHGWDFGEGYVVGNNDEIRRIEELRSKLARGGVLSVEEQKAFDLLDKKFKPADWLTGKKMLPSDAFTSKGLDYEGLETVEERLFYRPARKLLFTGPLLLIKEVVETETERVPTTIIDEGIAFKTQIFGIHAPAKDKAELERIKQHLENQRLLRFFLIATSGRYLVNKSSSILKKDIARFPYREDGEAFKLGPVEEAIVDDVLLYAAEFKRKGEDAIVRQAPTAEHLEQFGEFFCKVVESAFGAVHRSEPVLLKTGICFPFHFGERRSALHEMPGDTKSNIESLLTANVGRSLRCHRILRVYSDNMLLLVKPRQLRYWLRSVAIRDADEVFTELQGRGL